MGEKKNIDRLFRESFKNFEVTPDDAVWENIASVLGDKEKKKRVIPFWMQLGGIAAALLLLLTIGYVFLGPDEGIDAPEVVHEEILPQPTTNDPNTIVPDAKDLNKEAEGIVDHIVNEAQLSSDETEAKQKNSASHNAVAITNNGIDANDPSVSNSNSNAIKDDASDRVTSTDEGVAMVQKGKTKDNEQTNLPKNNTTIADVSKDTKKEVSGIDKTETIAKEIKGINEDAVVQNNEIKEKTDEAENTDKISLDDAIAQQKLIEEENVAGPTDKAKRWSLNPMVAPVYYNSIGDGSPINPEYSDNAKNGNINLSYGFNLAYQLSDRLTVRSGVNKVNLGYETEDISFSASLNGGNLQTIDYSENASNIQINDLSTGSASAPSAPTDNFGEITTSTSRVAEIPGIINQRLGYLEVPVELKYRLVDKKFGVNLIGGLSTLFLTDNAITLESDNLVTEIGEANNINDLSFSTNLGIGLDYKVNNGLRLNLEPMFKYQFNAFSRNAGDFKPYYLGVYTGFSFKF